MLKHAQQRVVVFFNVGESPKITFQGQCGTNRAEGKAQRCVLRRSRRSRKITENVLAMYKWLQQKENGEMCPSGTIQRSTRPRSLGTALAAIWIDNMPSFISGLCNATTTTLVSFYSLEYCFWTAQVTTLKLHWSLSQACSQLDVCAKRSGPDSRPSV